MTIKYSYNILRPSLRFLQLGSGKRKFIGNIKSLIEPTESEKKGLAGFVVGITIFSLPGWTYPRTCPVLTVRILSIDNVNNRLA